MSHLTIPTEDLRAATRALKSAKATRSLVGSMRVLADDDGIRKQTERLVARLEERVRSAKRRLHLEAHSSQREE